MGWHGYLALWCGVFGAVALVGYGRSLAGVTRAQRTVRVMGRIERVREPRHGASQVGGVSVVVTFQDPSTGEEFTVTNDGERGESIAAAWTGREVGVHYPPGRPHAFRFINDLWEGRHGLGLPNCAVFLGYAGLVAVVAIDRGWQWALLGFGVPWSVSVAYFLPQSARKLSRRIDRLTSRAAVPGRVIAVLKDVNTDEEGDTLTSHTPVVAFTTHEGAAVTAYCRSGLPEPVGSYGRDVTIHYDPDDPAVFTPDLAAERRSRNHEIALGVVALGIGVAAVAVGAAALLGG